MIVSRFSSSDIMLITVHLKKPANEFKIYKIHFISVSYSFFPYISLLNSPGVTDLFVIHAGHIYHDYYLLACLIIGNYAVKLSFKKKNRTLLIY